MTSTIDPLLNRLHEWCALAAMEAEGTSVFTADDFIEQLSLPYLYGDQLNPTYRLTVAALARVMGMSCTFKPWRVDCIERLLNPTHCCPEECCETLSPWELDHCVWFRDGNRQWAVLTQPYPAEPYEQPHVDGITAIELGHSPYGNGTRAILLIGVRDEGDRQ
jgi:hypothetical protein